ncbi:hypothetical protein CANMA_003624 [Candida margitis]|uniref:uncharacterized protein n=1 Tax=Candida margitis TaxID=1775924 RepID=UPI002225E058|nr:uncharacterized protein CANMA_003624 [Candida margitis]KAI5962849.1 hypothetical protein CANMA_003624 [Candida margitis]
MSTQYKLYDRVSTTDNHTATIKYVGHIPQWGPQILAYGLEWDDSNRGKNNGILKGVQYFTPTIANSASFIKSTNKNLNCDRKSFVQVIHQQYLDVSEHKAREIKFGNKVVEELGWQQLNQYQSRLQNLYSLSLDHQLIYCVANDMVGDVVGNVDDDVFLGLQNLTNLDLSGNLFTQMADIWSIVSRLPNLKVLNINGNRFASYEIVHGKEYQAGRQDLIQSNLHRLKMASTMIPIPQLNSILAHFPHLQELIISGNNYTNEDINLLHLVNNRKLSVLDLSYNNLATIPTGLPSSIQTLNVSHCQIKSVSNTTEPIDMIKSLDVRYNKLSTWLDIDNLSQVFPHLVDLRINHNPILDSLSIDEMTCQLIGRFECAMTTTMDNKSIMLNGSNLTASEIENGELYFISKVQSGQYEVNNSMRWNNLLHKYDKTDTDKKELVSSSTQPKRWINLKLKICCNKVKDEKAIGQQQEEGSNTANFHSQSTMLSNHKFLKTTSILKFKGLISRLYLSNLSILQFTIYYFINEDSNFATRYTLDENWLSCLNDYSLNDNQNIYIDIVTPNIDI